MPSLRVSVLLWLFGPISGVILQANLTVPDPSWMKKKDSDFSKFQAMKVHLNGMRGINCVQVRYMVTASVQVDKAAFCIPEHSLVWAKKVKRYPKKSGSGSFYEILGYNRLDGESMVESPPKSGDKKCCYINVDYLEPANSWMTDEEQADSSTCSTLTNHPWDCCDNSKCKLRSNECIAKFQDAVKANPECAQHKVCSAKAPPNEDGCCIQRSNGDGWNCKYTNGRCTDANFGPGAQCAIQNRAGKAFVRAPILFNGPQPQWGEPKQKIFHEGIFHVQTAPFQCTAKDGRADEYTYQVDPDENKRKKLGTGTMGTTFIIRNLNTNSDMVMKITPPDGLDVECDNTNSLQIDGNQIANMQYCEAACQLQVPKHGFFGGMTWSIQVYGPIWEGREWSKSWLGGPEPEERLAFDNDRGHRYNQISLVGPNGKQLTGKERRPDGKLANALRKVFEGFWRMVYIGKADPYRKHNILYNEDGEPLQIDFWWLKDEQGFVRMKEDFEGFLRDGRVNFLIGGLFLGRMFELIPPLMYDYFAGESLMGGPGALFEDNAEGYVRPACELGPSGPATHPYPATIIHYVRGLFWRFRGSSQKDVWDYWTARFGDTLEKARGRREVLLLATHNPWEGTDAVQAWGEFLEIEECKRAAASNCKQSSKSVPEKNPFGD